MRPYALLATIAASSLLANAAPRDLRKPGPVAMLECKVDGPESPEAALRQVDPHALLSMYCATGCDYAVNHATPHKHATYIKPICSVEKGENNVEMKKFTSQDDKSDKRRRSLQWKRRDIDAYTVGSATFRFSCTDQNGVDYTEAAAKRIGLELSICTRRPQPALAL